MSKIKAQIKELMEFHDLAGMDTLSTAEQFGLIKDASGKASIGDAYAAMLADKKAKTANDNKPETKKDEKPAVTTTTKKEKVEDVKTEVIQAGAGSNVTATPHLVFNLSPASIEVGNADGSWQYALNRAASWLQAFFLGAAITAVLFMANSLRVFG